MLERLSAAEIYHKLETMEQEIKELKDEIRKRLNSVGSVSEERVLLAVKEKWDSGIRSKETSTGKYFRAKDLCLTGDRELITLLYEYSGAKGVDAQIAVGRALSKLVNKSVRQGDTVTCLERYRVNSMSAYRFVEL